MSLTHVIAVRNCAAIKGSTQKSILFAIASRIGELAYAWPGEETIAMDSGVSVRSVKRHLVGLRKKSFLTRFRQPGIRSWCYCLGPAIEAPERVTDAVQETGHPGPTEVPNSAGWGANLSPKDKREGSHSKAKGRRQAFCPGIDYSSSDLPAIDDYADINRYDPILVAMQITGERVKTGWGHWVKRLRQAQNRHGQEKGTEEFQGCLHELFGLAKETHKSTLGAILNRLLREKFGELVSTERSAA